MILDGFITLLGGGPLERLRARRGQLEDLRAAIVADRAAYPEYAGADLAPRATPRQEAFDRGDDPLPAYSTIPPRRTGWERDYQDAAG